MREAILLIEVCVFVADVCAYKKPCQNGGECSSSGDSYTCSCVEGFQGENCENGKLKLKEKSVISESVRIKCLQYCDTFSKRFHRLILKNESLRLTK